MPLYRVVLYERWGREYEVNATNRNVALREVLDGNVRSLEEFFVDRLPVDPVVTELEFEEEEEEDYEDEEPIAMPQDAPIPEFDPIEVLRAAVRQRGAQVVAAETPVEEIEDVAFNVEEE